MITQAKAEKLEKFTLYWKSGDREVVEGQTVEDAMTRAGYGGGSVPALDCWASGDDSDRFWDTNVRQWKSRRVEEAIRQYPPQRK